MVYRIYVEKKAGFDHEAQSLTKEVRELLEINSVKSIRGGRHGRKGDR